MSGDPAIMICAGATKAGTSSLYRYLLDHPDVYARSIKEIHYFDTVDFDTYQYQLKTLARRRADLERQLAAAEADLDVWKSLNIQRQIADVAAVMSMLERGEEGVEDYLAYLLEGLDERKVACDITPAYALLSEERLRRMAQMAPDVRFVFLMRDPVGRLWSHVRMQAIHQLQPGEQISDKAHRIMNRVVKQGLETQITSRGDYVAIAEKLKRAVPEDKLLVGFTEDLLTGEGLKTLCAFLGIAEKPVKKELRAHQGVKLQLSDKQRREAAEFLAPQYAYVEKTFGQLPSRWQANMARI
ncbi:MAG: sulfotransferase [Alphaproteobacteria bacterium]|nr:sulfotransferase [Alphaproteobacteria bacterium]MBU1280148.1 sulfotransferase [Alphaproteobacteria bacterium]MBU1573352.1 sulfotransferase [Alphaproteobacteria bacterium]MBU1828793.1 sulfotransferase [Alphaproteobacteria bacterium]MBU2078985.1 sulfotransferase [Alphaproteobacteria bacterium]